MENRARSGRPKKLKDRDLRSLRRTLKENRLSSLSTITDQFNKDVAPMRIFSKKSRSSDARDGILCLRSQTKTADFTKKQEKKVSFL